MLIIHSHSDHNAYPTLFTVLTKGQVLTKYYRWMNKNGGWVWMQTKASLIPHPTNPELKQMLCLNYIVRLAFEEKMPQILSCLVVQ